MSCHDLPSYYIPYEVVVEILIRIPKKRSLARLKCVSREWKQMISHDWWFHEMRRNYKRRRKAWILRMSHYRFSSKKDGLKVSCEMKDSEDVTLIKEIILPHYHIPTVWDPKTPSRSDNLLFYFHSPCHNNLYLYDIKTDRVQKLPGASFSASFVFIYGFGYAYKSDEYKIVHLYHQNESSANDDFMNCEVYSTRKEAAASGSWRKISQDCPCAVSECEGRGVVANNRVHWMSKDSNRFALVSFDLNEEKFMTMPFSDLQQYYLYGYLANLKGRLCLVNQPFSCDEEQCPMRITVWAVKDYGEGTWECWCNISLRSFVLSDQRLYMPYFKIFRAAYYVGIEEQLVFVTRFGKDDYREVYCDLRESRITRVVNKAYGPIIISGETQS